jgi:excisionase family DNA binding protein
MEPNVTELARALVASLDEDDLAELAERLEPFLNRPDPGDGEWLDTKRAAAYLGLSRHALYRLTSEQRILFSQERPGGKCWFRRSELDAWRKAKSAGRPHVIPLR